MPDPIRRAQQSWCPYCHAPPGPDCPDVALDRRTSAKKNRADTQRGLRRARLHLEDPAA